MGCHHPCYIEDRFFSSFSINYPLPPVCPLFLNSLFSHQYSLRTEGPSTEIFQVPGTKGCFIARVFIIKQWYSNFSIPSYGPERKDKYSKVLSLFQFKRANKYSFLGYFVLDFNVTTLSFSKYGVLMKFNCNFRSFACGFYNLFLIDFLKGY